MGHIKFSILACTYGNSHYFKNFLSTVYNQDYNGNFEIIVVDNGTPDKSISAACYNAPNKKLKYYYILPKDKTCTNITAGINLAAQKAVGAYIVIIADPNVLLSYNLLSSIDNLINLRSVVLSAGSGNDVKISPDGLQQTEYADSDPKTMQIENDKLLKAMGWPCDPLNLKLLPNKHRWPPPHLGYDCYIVATSRINFIKHGGYPQTQTTWGRYHDIFTQKLAANLNEIRLTGVRIIHQFHRVYKENSV